ncbi:hypothetical protein AVEN_14745-1 [Araneus ventricosus]|uniref:Uncharacterized protein n=1 Tax=Araneus ventricosus TaxID=182803 RepID=A0A4Y2M8B6_ARAVE|nr:hypothetical protein AVEN_14745-1 [Araneus ventricosus]
MISLSNSSSPAPSSLLPHQIRQITLLDQHFSSPLTNHSKQTYRQTDRQTRSYVIGKLGGAPPPWDSLRRNAGVIERGLSLYNQIIRALEPGDESTCVDECVHIHIYVCVC